MAVGATVGIVGLWPCRRCTLVVAMAFLCGASFACAHAPPKIAEREGVFPGVLVGGGLRGGDEESAVSTCELDY